MIIVFGHRIMGKVIPIRNGELHLALHICDSYTEAVSRDLAYYAHAILLIHISRNYPRHLTSSFGL